ncbi:hypothetical protein PF010_g25264 [Phytophthora fragariae]|uniref:HTH CENPB-type domain-containing protein n=1 Tax=Phytophthora fragariae TaxID=53985 RepID=A0A6A3RB71_9STRA|nr:hypothetical protein PF003_g3633 [Phytophthora fragariae]KAE8912300.1 hypothetical protein PF003_g3636 [Phytophthora fragariae]KAE8923338.1 hypothetical protein PF009_g26411 [Phytophthora fragariae]KAE8975269.1 hypothetical protein PF011_g24549 [Phytophthora fragariae]KAE9072984.1 hypothetical protein PF010_g25264 [Phytophthora fragariae]
MTINHFYPELPVAKFNSRRTLIYTWKSSRRSIEALRDEVGGADKKKARKKGEATILSKEDEADLVRWICELRDEGVPVTATMLRLQAHEVAKAAGVAPFKASWCWQHHFKARHRLSLRCKTRQGQIRPPDLLETAQKFAEEVKQKAAEIGATRIYNADQTGIFI